MQDSPPIPWCSIHILPAWTTNHNLVIYNICLQAGKLKRRDPCKTGDRSHNIHHQGWFGQATPNRFAHGKPTADTLAKRASSVRSTVWCVLHRPCQKPTTGWVIGRSRTRKLGKGSPSLLQASEGPRLLSGASQTIKKHQHTLHQSKYESFDAEANFVTPQIKMPFLEC